MIVVDASVALKWLLHNEQDSANALALLKKPFKLIAPDLIRLEVHATLTKAVRRKILSPTDALLQMQRWRSSLANRAIIITHQDEDFSEAGQLSLDLQHPFYDCVYLTVAKKLHIPLATADNRLEVVAHQVSIEVFPWRK
ncbi:MAG: type II toxin-antitoxin system VapC family toxin [Iphinoe sp. HA4291-MV1]|jgi:predicted nucleic acid-binding protein|nr:type II toxin-antitoxin system VapC family toxin [Iphinoe sp. HA4291-MV1]